MVINPWAKIRQLQLALSENTNVFGRKIANLKRQLESTEQRLEDNNTALRNYVEANGRLIAEVTDLRNRNAALEAKTKHSHARDPKTGRILKKGDWNGSPHS